MKGCSVVVVPGDIVTVVELQLVKSVVVSVFPVNSGTVTSGVAFVVVDGIVIAFADAIKARATRQMYTSSRKKNK